MTSFQWGDGTQWGDGSTWGVGEPSAPEDLTAESAGVDAIDLSWTLVGNADAVRIYRARTELVDLSDYSFVEEIDSAESYTDSGLTNGREYHYRATAINPIGESEASNNDNATTDLPAPTVETDTTTIREVELSVVLNDNNDEGEVTIVRNDSTTVATLSDLQDLTATDTDLLDGTEYEYTAERDTGDATAISAVVTETTILPDEDQPVLGNGVKDEVSVDRETAVTNTGSVRYQIRRSEDSPDWETADSFQQFIGNFDTLTFEFVGLLDGEEYDVRGRTETDDATGTFTEPVSIVTKFPAVTDLTAESSVDGRSVDLTWTDNADNEDGLRVQQREVGVTDFFTRITLDPNTESYTDSTIPGRDYEYRIEAFTPFTSSTSDSVAVTTNGEPQSVSVSTSGWGLTLTHPTTGRTVSPDVLDNPEFDPSLNSLVTARIPVRKSEDLLEWPSGTAVELRLDGREQPLDEVVDFEQEADRTIIVAEGGLELDNRVRTEYQEERRHIAAGEIIEQETPYTADVDTPEFVGQEDVTLQEATTTLDFEDLALEIEDTDPIDFSGDTIEVYDTGFLSEAENAGTGGAEGTISDDIYSGGVAVETAGVGDNITFTFSVPYTIPAGDWMIVMREHRTSDGGDPVIFEAGVDNTVQFDDTTPNALDDLSWSFGSANNDFALSGSHTLRVEILQSGDDALGLDILGVFDTRYDYNFDNELNEPSGFLDGPETKPNAVDVVFDDATTPFVISEATATLSIDDTSNEQAVALSPDRGASFVEAENSDTVTAADLETPQVRLRTTLSRHSPDGPRDQTPRLGYASQTIDSFEVIADIRQESLLIDQTFDDSLESVLNQIAGDEYVWSYRLEDGTPTVAWSQPGQRTSDSDPDIDADVSVTKNLKTWEAVTIKGSSQSVSGERFDGSTTFQSLNRENIVPGSESVGELDGDTDFRRGEDYEMRYNDGEIRILDSSDMSSGTTYEIDYRFEVEGTFPADYEGSNELVKTISGVVSDRQAQQLAYTVLEIDPGVSHPSYSADVLLPRGDLFDPLEALSLEQLNLPDESTPIEIREPPQRTPDGIALRLGAQDPLAGLNRLSNQLQSVSRRS